jgi:hypothetical protein
VVGWEVGQEGGYYVARPVRFKLEKTQPGPKKKLNQTKEMVSIKKVNNGQHTFNHWMRNPNHHVDKIANWCWWALVHAWPIR